jgi:hypothetical protein
MHHVRTLDLTLQTLTKLKRLEITLSLCHDHTAFRYAYDHFPKA